MRVNCVLSQVVGSQVVWESSCRGSSSESQVVGSQLEGVNLWESTCGSQLVGVNLWESSVGEPTGEYFNVCPTAAKKGYLDILRYFNNKHPTLLHDTDGSVDTLLFEFAVWFGQHEVFMWLIETFEFPFEDSFEDQFDLLELAVKGGCLNNVKVIHNHFKDRPGYDIETGDVF